MEEELILPGDDSRSPIKGSEPPQSATSADMDREVPGSASIMHDGEVADAGGHGQGGTFSPVIQRVRPRRRGHVGKLSFPRGGCRTKT